MARKESLKERTMLAEQGTLSQQARGIGYEESGVSGATPHAGLSSALRRYAVKLYFDNQVSGVRDKRRIEPPNVVPPSKTSLRSGHDSNVKTKEQKKTPEKKY